MYVLSNWKGNNKSPPLGLHLHRDLLEASFRMDHKKYTSCSFSKCYWAIAYFWRKRRRNNGQDTWSNNADGKVLHLQMQVFKSHRHTKLCFSKEVRQRASIQKHAWRWRETWLRIFQGGMSGRPNYVFFSMVPILPAVQWQQCISERYPESCSPAYVCVCEGERDSEREINISIYI